MDPTAAAPADLSWPQALVAIVTALLPLAWAIVELLRRKQAQKQRDAIIKGVERVGHKQTKMSIKAAAEEAGLESSLKPEVNRVTGRLGNGANLLLLLLAPLMLSGCCSLSHADVELIKVSKAANLGHMQDETLPPQARWVAQDNFDAFCQLDRAATGAEIPADVRERLGLDKEED